MAVHTHLMYYYMLIFVPVQAPSVPSFTGTAIYVYTCMIIRPAIRIISGVFYTLCARLSVV